MIQCRPAKVAECVIMSNQARIMEAGRFPGTSTSPARRATLPHPLGSRAQVLLTSVFGPYAQDDEYGSRAINPMELYHNQVTRVQGPFSLRMFHRSWGLMLIQANIGAPCTLLDFPTLDRFVEEIRNRAVRSRGDQQHHDERAEGQADVRVGPAAPARGRDRGRGHMANIPDLQERVDADWIVRGEGVRVVSPLPRRRPEPSDPAPCDAHPGSAHAAWGFLSKRRRAT